jgi:hypothetical protein
MGALVWGSYALLAVEALILVAFIVSLVLFGRWLYRKMKGERSGR